MVPVDGQPAAVPGTFAALVCRAMAARGITCLPAAGGLVRINGPQPGVLALANVWQVCLQTPKREWATVISRFLDRVLPGLEPPPDEGYEEVRPALRVRLLPDQPAVAGTPADLDRPLATGIRAVAAIDRPTMVEIVLARRAERWGIPAEEIFAVAFDNVRSEPPPRPAVWEAGGVRIMRFGSASFYTTTWVRWLPDLLGSVPAAGALVGVPARHELLVYPLSGIGALRAIRPMAEAITTAFRLGPGSLSPQLYWWRAAAMHALPLVTEAGVRRFMPSDEFLDALNGAA